MIVFDRVWKDIETKRTRIPVLRNFTAAIPTDRRLAIFGLPGSGKTTLIDLISGIQRPDRGRVSRDAIVSAPVGRPLGLISAHSLRRNCVFVARLHGLSPVELIRFVAATASVERYMDMELGQVSPDVVSRFRYALAYGVPADTYVIDGNPLPRGAEMRDRFATLIHQRAQTSGLILCTQSPQTARLFCDVGAVLHEGRLTFYAELERALSAFYILRTRHLASSESEASETNLQNARRALRRRNFELASQIAEAEAEANGENGIAFWLLGEVALAQGDRPKALGLIRQACELGPDLKEPWAALSRLAGEEQDPVTRVALALTLLDHESSAMRRSGAKLIERSGDMLAALDAWRNVLSSQPDDPVILIEAADMESQHGNYAEALAIADRALDIDALSWRTLFFKIRMEQMLERYSEMAMTVASLARLRPDIARRFVRVIVRAGLSDAAAEIENIIHGRASADSDASAQTPEAD